MKSNDTLSPEGVVAVSDVSSGLLKMVTAAVETENLTGPIYIEKRQEH